MHFLQGYYIL